MRGRKGVSFGGFRCRAAPSAPRQPAAAGRRRAVGDGRNSFARTRGLNPQLDVYSRTKSSHIFRHAKFAPAACGVALWRVGRPAVVLSSNRMFLSYSNIIISLIRSKI